MGGWLHLSTLHMTPSCPHALAALPEKTLQMRGLVAKFPVHGLKSLSCSPQMLAAPPKHPPCRTPAPSPSLPRLLPPWAGFAGHSRSLLTAMALAALGGPSSLPALDIWGSPGHPLGASAVIYATLQPDFICCGLSPASLAPFPALGSDVALCPPLRPIASAALTKLRLITVPGSSSPIPLRMGHHV